MSYDGWFPDPSRIHESRYFDGTTWTHHVSDRGMRSIHQWSPAAVTAAVPDSASWYEPTTIQRADAPPAYGQGGYSGHWQPPPLKGTSAMSGTQVGIIAAVIALVVIVAGGAGIYAATNDPAPRDPIAADSSPTPNTQRTPAPDNEPTPSDEPPTTSQTEAPGSGERPQWKSTVQPVSVKGPQFGPGEPVYTMAFSQWPFAFRVPSTFGCLRGTVDLPDAKGYVCINEATISARHRINIMFRPCPTTCTRSEQQKMTTDWFAAPGERPTVFDATTSYLEDPSNDKGLYGLDMSHFFGDKPGGPLRWQVGIYIESPTATKTTLHKVVNDVRSQTP